MKVHGKVIVVTGGASGIGRALVLELLKRGASVAAVDLNESALRETAALVDNTSRLSTHVINITDRSAVEALPMQVTAHHGQIDGLINNAGIIQPFKRIIDLDYPSIERVMNVNFWGMLYMTKSFLPVLLQRSEAHIVNISSMGAYAPVPGQSIYGASKAAVKLMTEGLYAELLETHVGVTAVFPGATATNISVNSGVAIEAPAGADAASFKTLPAADAAVAIVDGMEAGKYHVFTGSDAKMMDRIARYAPNRVAKIIYKQMKSLLG